MGRPRLDRPGDAVRLDRAGDDASTPPEQLTLPAPQHSGDEVSAPRRLALLEADSEKLADVGPRAAFLGVMDGALGKPLGWDDEVTENPSVATPVWDREHRHRDRILAAIEHNFPNGLVESTNTKVRLITRMACGFASPEPLIALALLSLSGHRPTLPGPQMTHGPVTRAGNTRHIGHRLTRTGRAGPAGCLVRG